MGELRAKPWTLLLALAAACLPHDAAWAGGFKSLAQTGLIAPGTLKKLGAVFSADGIVSGSFVTLGSKVLVNARLINVETGLIVAACESEAPREWFEEPASAQEPAAAPPTDPLKEVRSIFPDDAGALLGSAAEEGCSQAAGALAGRQAAGEVPEVLWKRF